VRILLDTNILLRIAHSTDREHGMVRSAVDALADRGYRACFFSQNLVEFWNVCTRPSAQNGLGLSVIETDRRAELIESEMFFLQDDERVHSEWRRLVVDYSVSGVQVHDARLVAAMLAHGVRELLTLNARDFKRYREISALHPRDVVPAM
jgi:predicted nucleic acid-binding protein